MIEDLIGQYDDRRIQPAAMYLFGHFQANETGPDDYRSLGLAIIDLGFDPIRVFQVAECENVVRFRAANERKNGRRSRGRDETVVQL